MMLGSQSARRAPALPPGFLITLAFCVGCNAIFGIEEPVHGDPSAGASAGQSGAGGSSAGQNTGSSGSSSSASGGSSTTQTCGDGVVDSGEKCDDGDLEPGDGCNADCRVERGWDCDQAEPTICKAICGDGFGVGPEATAGGCDDGGMEPGDGCSKTCAVEAGFVCSSEPSACAKTCGNARLDAGETCEDGNSTTGDGCSACNIEPGFACDNAQLPSSCDDVDECKVPSHDCASHAYCTNTVGSFSCACQPGYGGNGKTCTNVNECVFGGGNNCSRDADCTDTEGSFTCMCKPGFSGNGKTCSDLPPSCPAPIQAHSTSALTRTCWKASATDCGDSLNVPNLKNPPEYAIDLDTETRFSTGAHMVSSKLFKFDVDMGSTATIDGVSFTWADSDYPPEIEVAVSPDAATWTPVACGALSSASQRADIAFAPVSARYVRMVQHGVVQHWWSIYDFKVYGPGADTCQAATTTACTPIGAANPASCCGTVHTIN